jgi:DNA-binding transcriptional LysR family regulator
MLPSDLTSLATFLAVAEERSFTKAAKRRGVSPSAISHAMRTLEEELGVRLLARTTRSVALTEAGEQLVGRLKPALTDVGQALDDIAGQRNRPGGRVRLLVPRLAVSSVLAPKLGILNSKYPDIVLDVTSDDSRRDIVVEGFDAGIHFGEYIEKDMIAVRVSPDQRCHRRIAWIYRIPNQTKGTTRSPAAPMHQLPARCGWSVSMGVRKGQKGNFGRSHRAADR